MLLHLLLTLLLQAPEPSVVVGLNDGMKVTLANPEFAGFIEGRNGEAVLMYRNQKTHGEIPLNTISRIEFGRYKQGQPFQLKVTLRSGDEMNVESEHRDFVTIKGKTEFGTVTIKHPDPISAPLKLSTGKPSRKKSLTIQYLEFPSS